MTDKIPTSKELILLAEHDWHNREERRGIHQRPPWTAGWITGFLSTEKPSWDKILEDNVRADERKRVIQFALSEYDKLAMEGWNVWKFKEVLEDLRD